MNLPTSRTNIITGIAIIAGLALAILVLYPKYQQIGATKATIEEDRIRLSEIEQLGRRSSDLSARTTELTSKLEQLSARFFTPATSLDYITKLEALGSDNGIQVEVSKFDPPTAQATTGSLKYSARGPLGNLLSFLYATENSQWLVSPDSITLAPASTGLAAASGAPNEAMLSVEATTFWQSRP